MEPTSEQAEAERDQLLAENVVLREALEKAYYARTYWDAKAILEEGLAKLGRK